MWKRLIVAAGIVVVVALAVAVGLSFTKVSVTSKEASLSPDEQAALAEKGRYLAIAGDCAACHTRNGGEEYAGGRGLETPFGIIYSPNVTSDKQTGLGDWTLADFERALHHGQDDAGDNLYPAFSYPYYAKVSKDDVAALWAYFKTIPAVNYEAPKNELGFPFNIRLLLKGWNLLHFRGGEFKPDPMQSAEWNRGAYLVEGLGHCGACHTPKNMMGGDRNGQRLKGGVLEGWFASDLTGDEKTGLAAWSEQDIVDFLQTGGNMYTSAYGSMAEVVRLSTSQMTPEDLQAIAVYLKSQPGEKAPPAGPKPDEKIMAHGQEVYEAGCTDCHLEDGTGIPTLYPPLAGNPNVNANDPSSIIQITLDGSGHEDNPSPYGEGMAAFPQLSDKDVADMATYIRNSWGNSAPAVKENDVLKIRELINGRKEMAAE